MPSPPPERGAVSVDLFGFVDMFDRQLMAAAHLLDRGAAHCGDDAEAMLDWRLAEDMQPLRFQVRVVIDFSRSWTARATGIDLPGEFGDQLDLAGFRAAIADTRAWLATLTRAQFASRDDVALTVPLGFGLEPTMPAGRWITHFATTNIYFHLSMLYAILRARGVPIGKIDLFAGQL